jgi:hypothetical protein
VAALLDEDVTVELDDAAVELDDAGGAAAEVVELEDDLELLEPQPASASRHPTTKTAVPRLPHTRASVLTPFRM